MKLVVCVWLICIICPLTVLAIFPFQDTSLPWDKRVEDVVMRLTIEEIANQTIVDAGRTTVPRLGIKPYVWGTECERGQLLANTTAFPHSIGLAAARSTELVYNMTTILSTEMRAQWNAKRKTGTYTEEFGLSCFSPVINIARHPLWGRIQETYGECPFMTGSLTQSFISGLHGTHPRYYRASGGCKHMDAYNGPENIPVNRLSFNSKVSMRDWRMTFLPAFKMCVDGGSNSLMCSYNSINSIPACANGELLTNITRKEWGFKGYIVTDAVALQFMQTYHHYTKTPLETAVAAINAGVNLDLGTTILLNQVDALNKGMLTEQQLRDNVKPLFYTRMRLGEMDPENMNPYNSINMSVVQSAAHQAQAVIAAQMSYTLLKNDMNVLPLKGPVAKLAIVGPFSNVSDQLFGDYSSNVVPQVTTTVWQGLKKLGTNTVTMSPGCDDTRCMNYNSADISKAVVGSDLVIVALGTGQAVETEGSDRANMDLPGHQLDLLQDAVYYANGSKVIVLLFNAGPLDITWAKFNQKVHAIMECYFPAQSTGKALYNTLTAASADAVPAGRLPMTWPAYLGQVPSITDYAMSKGFTYRYFLGEPLYPFGYGLSYTTFSYSVLSVSPTTLTRGQNLTVSVAVKNTGVYDGDEVIQLYISWPIDSTVPVPKLQQVGFKRQRLLKNQQLVLTFKITSDQLAVWVDDKTRWNLLPGTMMLYAGGQQPNQRTSINSNVLSTSFQIKV